MSSEILLLKCTYTLHEKEGRVVLSHEFNNKSIVQKKYIYSKENKVMNFIRAEVTSEKDRTTISRETITQFIETLESLNGVLNTHDKNYIESCEHDLNHSVIKVKNLTESKSKCCTDISLERFTSKEENGICSDVLGFTVYNLSAIMHAKKDTDIDKELNMVIAIPDSFLNDNYPNIFDMLT